MHSNLNAYGEKEKWLFESMFGLSFHMQLGLAARGEALEEVHPRDGIWQQAETL